MLRIGCHLSSSKGYCAMAKDALEIRANTFQYFSRNPRGGNAKALDQEDIARFLVETDKNDIHPFSLFILCYCVSLSGQTNHFFVFGIGKNLNPAIFH